jgi:hypothetical protein
MGLRMQGNRSAQLFQGQYGRNQGRMRSVAPSPTLRKCSLGLVGLHVDGEVRAVKSQEYDITSPFLVGGAGVRALKRQREGFLVVQSPIQFSSYHCETIWYH